MLFGSSNQPNSSNGKESWSSWLDRTERESWQMELLLSGFVIILLVQAKAPLDRWLEVLNNNGGINDLAEVLSLGANVLLPGAWFVLFSSLVFGVILRALWISAIGLRSVSGDIDLDSLKFSPKFDAFLRRRVPGFDDYIARLENICSIVFGLTFLAVFALVGASILIIIILLLLNSLRYFLEAIYEDRADSLGVFMVIFFTIFTVLSTVLAVYIVDFFSGSKLKQLNGFSKVYYPVYRVLGWLTLARIYRPIYYNFIDNRVGKYGLLAVIPYGILLISISQFNNSSFTNLLPRQENYAYGGVNSYMDTHEGVSMSKILIGSKFVENDQIDLYIPLGGRHYKIIEEACNEQSQSYDKLRFVSLTDGDRQKRYDEFITCLTCTYSAFVDTTEVPLPVGILVQNPVNGESQILTSINVDAFGKGGHVLRIIAHLDTEKKSREFAVNIPFFKR